MAILSFAAKFPKDNKVFAANDYGQIFDVTESSNKPTQVAGTAQIDGIWDYTNSSGLEDNFLCMVSPLGGYWTYSVKDGFKQRQITGDGAGKQFSAIFNFKDRLWFIEAGSTRTYYLGVGALWGEAKMFDLSSVLNEGGFISYGTNWTYNAGKDINDYLIFVTTRGEVIVYSGYNPDDATNFTLTGVWYVGATPAGNQCFTQFGGEVFIMSALGVVPVSKLVNGGVANEYQVSSYRIQPQLQNIFNEYQAEFGWAMDMIYNQTFLLLQVPVNRSGQYIFFAMNVATGAWATISGMPMNCATQINNTVYFGTPDGRVCLGFVGDSDGELLDGTPGRAIIGRYTAGFNNFGNGAYLKTFQLARPVFIATEAPAVGCEVLTQYPFNYPHLNPTPEATPSGVFDKDKWNECVWGGGPHTYSAWVGLDGLGYYGALALSFTGPAGTQYVTTNLSLTVGGVI